MKSHVTHVYDESLVYSEILRVINHYRILQNCM